MKLGIFSDVHGHYLNLERVLNRLMNVPVDRLVFLGDILGSFFFRKRQFSVERDDIKCLDMIFQYDAIMLAGNHDDMGMEFLPASYRSELKARLRFKYRIDDILFSHTKTSGDSVYRLSHTSWDNNRIDDPRKAFLQFKNNNFFLFCYGHTHRAQCFILENDHHLPVQMNLKEDTQLQLKCGLRYLFNPGPVTEIKDNFIENPSKADFRIDKPSFAVYDTELRTMAFKILEEAVVGESEMASFKQSLGVSRKA